VVNPVQPGDVLGEKYLVERVIAQGGMGVVVAARHLSLEQPVALKFMLPEVLGDAAAVERFQREARTVARLRSEHVARILDVGELENGVPFIAMEYLEGCDLGTLFARGVETPLHTAIDYVLQAAEAVAEAHALGIVHRDIKPENLFLTTRRDGTPLVKVLDFGISKVVSGSARARAVTTTKEVMGSPAYMSPEQLVSTRDVDGRTDIWSLGAILYELAAGEPAFYADTLVQLCVKVMQEPHPPLGERCGPLPDGFEAVVDRCLEKDKDLRYSTVSELALALEPFAPARSRAAIDRIVGILGAPEPALAVGSETRSRATGSATMTSWGDSRPGDRGARAFLAIGAIALGTAGAYVSLRGRFPGLDSSGVAAQAAAAPAPASESALSTPEPPPAPQPSATFREPVSVEPPAVTVMLPTSRASAATSPPPRAPQRPAPVRAPIAPPRDDGPWPPSNRTEPPARGGEEDVYSVRK